MGSVRRAGRVFSPLDEELGLLPRRYTPRLVEQIVRLGTSVGFDAAERLLRSLLGVEVPGDTVRRLTEGVGRRALQLETDAAVSAHSLSADLAAPVRVVDRLQQVSVDGVMVPLVGGEWAEVKHLVIGRIERTVGGPRARGLSYFARLADHDRFRALAGLEFNRRSTEHAREVVAVTDGAEWIQGFLDAHCPDALRIIDWGHASGYVTEAGQALFGPGTADCSAWVGTQLHLLWTDDPQRVVDELARVEAASGLEAVHTARQYLEKRLDQVRYAAFRQGGYPVGSGIVESGNKAVVEDRLKGRGRHWARANVDPMLVLRGTDASERWEERWPHVQATLGRPHHRRPVLAPPPPGPTAPSPVPSPARRPDHAPTFVNGRPTRAHPWNRHPACSAKS